MRIREFLSLARFFFRRSPVAELDEELAFPLEREVEANLAAGMRPGEARRRALVEFGGFELAREETHRQRPGWFLETLGQDARYAVRGFRRNPAYTVTVIATLALGIGAATAVLSVVDRVPFRSLPYAQDDRLVSVGLGASRGRLMRQTMTEALLLALAAAVAGCLLAALLLRLFVALAPASIPFLATARLDPRVIAFAPLVSLLCAFCFGMVAAREGPRTEALGSKSAQSVDRARLRRLLVAGQIAVSMVLLASAGLLLRSFWNLERQSLGIETRNVLTVHVPLNWERYPGSARMEFYRKAEAALRGLPGVSAVGMSDSLPPDGDSWHGGMRYADLLAMGRPPHPAGVGGTVVTRSVTPGYFRVLGIPMLEGAGFTEEEQTAPGNFLVLVALAATLIPARKAMRVDPAVALRSE